MSLEARVNLIADSIKCDAGSVTEYSFDVENTSDRTLAVGIEPLGESKGWVALVNRDDAELELPPRGVQRVAVKVTVPADAAAKRYSFKLRVYDARTPTLAIESGAVAIDVARDEPLPPPPPPPNGKKNWLPIIIAASVGGVVLIGGIIGLIIWLTSGSPAVPNLIGMTAQEAGEQLAADGFPEPSISEEATGESDPGLIVRQDPEPGAEMPEDGIVSIVIEQLSVPVPRLRGLTVAAAESALINAGLAMGERTFETTGNSPGGAVLDQDPAEGSPAIPGMTVNVTVERELVPVPGLDDQSFSAATARLDEVGLLISKRNEVNTGGPPGTVAAQEPVAGTPVERGTTILVDLEAQRVAVPASVVGKTLDAATRDVVRSQLVVAQVLNTYTGSRAVGLVETSDPAPNTSVPVGSPVTLYVRAQRRPITDIVAVPIQDLRLKNVLLQQTIRTQVGGVRSVPPADEE
jgi:beta-lactam-binding protein with PASTA domain